MHIIKYFVIIKISQITQMYGSKISTLSLLIYKNKFKMYIYLQIM